jgi:uncharacterized membrane protein
MLVNLKKRLLVWQEHGLISEGDARTILEFEASQVNRSWVSFGIAGIGVTAFITGIISILASNWEFLSDSVKIAGYFILQVGFGLLFLRYETNRSLTREVALTVFALFFWAGIGLFAQIYNLSGPAWRPLMFWVCITLPAAMSSNSRFLCMIWCTAVLATPWVWSCSYMNSFSELTRVGIVVASAVMLATIGIAERSVAVIKEPLRLASVECGLGFLMLCAVPVGNIEWVGQHIAQFDTAGPLASLLLPWMACGLAAAASLTRANVPIGVRRTTALLFVGIAIYLSLPYLLPLNSLLPLWLRQVFGAAGFLVVWAIAATAAALASLKRLFDIASLVIAVRFIIIYFEVFGSLSATGIGLIISGAVIISVAIAWNRARRSVTSKLQGPA